MPASNASQTLNDVFALHSFHQGTDALQVAMTTSHKGYVLHTVLIVNLEVDEATAGTFGLVLEGLHV